MIVGVRVWVSWAGAWAIYLVALDHLDPYFREAWV